MKIDKAIERLQGSLDHNTILITRGDKEALKLGIEALIRVRDDRGTSYQPQWYLLPSETMGVK